MLVSRLGLAHGLNVIRTLKTPRLASGVFEPRGLSQRLVVCKDDHRMAKSTHKGKTDPVA
jgi:hypothetical protein